jgi:N-methylhydantoinase A
MKFSVAIDIGGTFTDCVIEDETGDVRIVKAPSTPGAFEKGFMESLRLAADLYGLGLANFLAATRRIVHGSTVSTNALVERKTVPTGFMCNAGHPDILTIREAVPKPVFDWRLDYPDPYVMPSSTVEIRGRIDSSGREIEPLDEFDVRAGIARLRRNRIEAIGVCLLWSIVNGAHERRVREIINAEWPEVPVTLSHELNAVGREYRRAISTVIDASLNPIIRDYVGKLTAALREGGYRSELLLANCIGGMMPPNDLMARPIYSVMSGPTLAPVAAQQLTAAEDVIVVDMGGTTFDVSAVRQGRLIVSQDATIGNDMLGIPKIDVRSVGAGGGSIAWVDRGGLLKVGPQSAGAVPGPSCYGLGGEWATVTDANVVLGILDPDYFLGGKIRLDRAAAERAVGAIARQLGLTLEEAAYTIYTTSNHTMVGLITEMTVKEGLNPRDSLMVVGGGATSAHICEISDALGLRNVMVPQFAAGLSAWGGLRSDIRWEEQRAVFTSSIDFNPDRVNPALAELLKRGRSFLDAAGVDRKRQRFEFAYLGRYRYQSWDIEVPFELPEDRLTAGDASRLVAAFHDLHERIYSVRAENDVVEFTTWKVRAIGPADRNDVVKDRPTQAGKPKPKSTRPVYFRERGGMVSCPIFGGSDLGAGARVDGPSVIEEETTTIVVLPRWTAEMDRAGNYHLFLQEP